ncbi:MAG: hypothetical protein JW751_05000 [Polyangiaceae bacterium]|nr:hypothetical protein [Polyangiaceae bacterium]
MAKPKQAGPVTPRPGVPNDDVSFDGLAPGVCRIATSAGVALLAVSVGLGATEGDGFRRFLHSYLVAFMYVLSLGLGALWWVTLQHLVGARWSVVVRRIGELLASSMPALAVLSLPIIASVLLESDRLFPWVDPSFMQSQSALAAKRPYLNPGFFVARWAIYFSFWTALGYWLLRCSLAQDATGGTGPLDGARKVSPLAMIGFAITATCASVDYIMTLDPTWYSTVFGVYYFAGCVIAIHSAMVLIVVFLQHRGRLTRSVTPHHFHDLGKMMFAFTVFWAYIAFSQLLLVWYANLPEETVWYRVRSQGSWFFVAVVLVIGHFGLPFFGLLSRHAKRHRASLSFWAGWLLVLHFVDLYFLIMPTFYPGGVSWRVPDLTTWLGLLALFVADVARRARGRNLVPSRDPRLAESLAFENS